MKIVMMAHVYYTLAILDQECGPHMLEFKDVDFDAGPMCQT